MKKKVLVLYDDRIRPNEKIAQISGDKSYGSIIFKQKTIQKRIEEIVLERPYVLGFYPFSDENQAENSIQTAAAAEFGTSVFYLYSSYGIGDREDFEILLDKTQFLNQAVRVTQKKKTAVLMFPSTDEFLK